MDPAFDRYAKQVLFAGIGEAGQRLLATKRVLICGCGALGTVVADQLTRAGVGHLRIVDRDFVELSNLQRQILFDERDVESRTPKAIAAAEKLRRINSRIEIEPIVADVDFRNIEEYCRGVDLIVDGTDNFEVRFLLNDASLEFGIPWIYTGCIGSHGQIMPIFPGESACLRCLMPELPDSGSLETCDTAGVIGPAVNVIASWEAALALKILSGQRDEIRPTLTVIDVWNPSFREMNLASLRESGGCPACGKGERDWLQGKRGSQSVILCGRNAVQVVPEQKQTLSLDEMRTRLELHGKVTANPYLLRFEPNESELELTLFRDGRAIVKGTENIGEAKSVYARYVGT
jgi:molybdopterin/thiamine biosynthesis adenylyltransferase